MLNRLSIKGRMLLVVCSILFLFTLLLWFAVTNSTKVRDMGLEKTGAVMLADQKAKLQVATHSMALTLGHAIEGVEGEEQRINLIRKLVDDIRFEEDKSGYYFVYNKTINVALPPAKAKQGTDLGQAKDKNGVFFCARIDGTGQQGRRFRAICLP